MTPTMIHEITMAVRSDMTIKHCGMPMLTMINSELCIGQVVGVCEGVATIRVVDWE